MNIIKKSLIASLSVMALLSSQSEAATATGTFNVSATTANICSVTATDLSFGVYLGTANLDSMNTISTTCSNGASYTIDIGTLNNSGGIPTAGIRRLKNSTNYLQYFLYSDVGRVVGWLGGISWVGNGSVQTINLYGRITLGQPMFSGSWSDTATVTITYTP